jgi:chromosome segregation ATPase
MPDIPDNEDATSDTSSTTPISTALVCTTNVKASLPTTPTSTIETAFPSRGIKRTRAERCGGDGDDEDPPAKRGLVTVNEGGLGFDALFASYVTSATEPVYQRHKELHSVVDEVRALHKEAASKSETELLALRTQCDEHTKKYEGHDQKIDGLVQRTATVEKDISDFHKLRDDTAKHATKLSQLELGLVSEAMKAKTADLDRRISEHSIRLDGLDAQHKDTDDLIRDHKSRLQSQETKLEKQESRLQERVQTRTVKKLVSETKDKLLSTIAEMKSDLNTRLKATDAVAQEASKLGKDLGLKLEEYRTEADTKVTAGFDDLKGTITPLQTEAVALRTAVAALQSSNTEHKYALSKTATKDDVYNLTNPIHQNLGALEKRHKKLLGAVDGFKTRTESLEAHREKELGAVETVVKKTDTMQQSIETFETQTKLFTNHLDVAVPEMFAHIQSLKSRVDTLEKKIAIKADASALTSQKASPKTPAESSATPTKHSTNFDEITEQMRRMARSVENHRQGLVIHTSEIKEIKTHREKLDGVQTRIDQQDKELEILKQVAHDFQVKAATDNDQLRQDLDKAVECIKMMGEKMVELGARVFSPPVVNALNNPSAKSSHRRSSQAEVVPDDAIEKLNKRMDINWTKFVEKETLIWNKIDANKTLTDATLSKVERITSEVGPRIDSLERISNHNDQRISELWGDMNNCFQLVITHSDNGFQRCLNTFENEIMNYAARTNRRLDVLEEAPSSAGAASKAPKWKTDAVINKLGPRVTALDHDNDSLRQRVTDLETVNDHTQSAMQSSSESVKALEERMSNAENCHRTMAQAANTASAKLDNLEARMTNSEAAYSAIQPAPTASISSVSKAEFNTLLQDFDNQKIKYDDALVAVKNFERNNFKGRITTVEKKLKEIGDIKSSFTTAKAAYITSERMDSAVEDLEVSFRNQIESCKIDLEKAIGE